MPPKIPGFEGPYKEPVPAREQDNEEDVLWSTTEALDYAKRHLFPLLDGQPGDPHHELRKYADTIGVELDDENLDHMQEVYQKAFDIARDELEEQTDEDLINLIQDHDDGLVGDGDDLVKTIVAAEILRDRQS